MRGTQPPEKPKKGTSGGFSAPRGNEGGRMTVLIPAFEPEPRLPALVRTLRESGLRVVVVDDGSGAAYADVFAQARAQGAEVLTHRTNLGKGCALKTGFAYIAAGEKEREGVVTADADGQHRPADIKRLVRALQKHPEAVALGVRRFAGRVPARSAAGNLLMRLLFSMASGRPLRDTQTGLRAFPAALLPRLTCIRGARFEYEMNVLLDLANAGCAMVQIPVPAVYEPGNSVSHFRPVADSVRVLLPTLRYGFTSAAAALTEFVLLFVFHALTGSLFFGVLLARICSSSVQYLLNRALVFRSRVAGTRQPHRVGRYYLVVAGVLLCNYLLLRLFTGYFHMWLLLAKPLTDFLLFFVSYAAQRFVVFRRPAAEKKSPV